MNGNAQGVKTQRFINFVRLMLVTGATLYLVTYIIVALLRMPYRFELNWMEGGTLDHVKRILAGQKIYVSPSIDFVPFVYNPFYYYAAATFAIITGIGFLPLRLLSFLSSLASMLFIYLIVKKETSSKFNAYLAACLYAATFQISGGYFDTARIDSLFLLFILAAVYTLRFRENVPGYLLTAILMFMAFLTKQSALMICLPLVLYALWCKYQLGALLMITIVALTGGAVILLNSLHDGWYFYYTFEILRRRENIMYSMILDFWRLDIFSPLPFAFILSAFYIFFARGKQRFFYFMSATAMITVAWASRLDVAGAKNTLFPAYAAISILFGLGIQKVIEFGAYNSRKRNIELFLYVLCVLQFASLFYHPRAMLPSQKDVSAGEKLIAAIAQIDGDIFIPYHTYLSGLAGKQTHLHMMGTKNVLDGGGRGKEVLEPQIKRAIQEQQFQAIFLDYSWLIKEFELERYYRKEKTPFDDDTTFWTLTGWKLRPDLLYVPKFDQGSPDSGVSEKRLTLQSSITLR